MRIRTRQVETAPRAPTRVSAYHGCHRDTAEQILSGEPLRESRNEYDWLGSGIYFWEYAPYRALEWARQCFGDNGVVIEANVALKRCLNLLDSVYFIGLQTAYNNSVSSLQSEGIPIPVNKRGRHTLDRLIVDKMCDDYVVDTGTPFATVRGCFPEGQPVYDGSKILRYTHVQIAVRDRGCISGLKLVHFE